MYGRKRAVFLDRDGVLNEPVIVDGKPRPPETLSRFVLLPNVASALLDLKAAGFLLLVITNQPDVARGIQSRQAIELIHAHLRGRLPVDDILVCWHDDGDRCECRKPKPGLLHAAARQYEIDLPSSFVVGDRWRDIEAGWAAGCTSILVDYSYRERQPHVQPAVRVKSLRAAAYWILAREKKGFECSNWTI